MSGDDGVYCYQSKKIVDPENPTEEKMFSIDVNEEALALLSRVKKSRGGSFSDVIIHWCNTIRENEEINMDKALNEFYRR